ncbi:MAG: NifU family protein [Acidimicrobiales bacterium]|nr:NifU family protein [Acidimicrobiales bacterium]
MTDTATVAEALVPVREMLQLDGADIELVDVTDDGTAHLRLLLVEAGCAECVLPTAMLEGVALQLMTPFAPGLTAVTIDDPRTT